MLFCSVIKVPFRILPLLSFLSYYCHLLVWGYSLLVFVQLCFAKMHSCLNYRIILLYLWTSSGIEQDNFLLQDGSGKCNPSALFIVMCGNDSCMFVSDFRMHRTCYKNGSVLMLHIFVIIL